MGRTESSVSRLRDCRLLLRFNGDFHLGALLETHLLAIFIDESVLDAKLSIEVVGPFDGDLRFLRFAGRWRLYYFLFATNEGPALALRQRIRFLPAVVMLLLVVKVQTKMRLRLRAGDFYGHLGTRSVLAQEWIDRFQKN